MAAVDRGSIHFYQPQSEVDHRIRASHPIPARSGKRPAAASQREGKCARETKMLDAETIKTRLDQSKDDCRYNGSTNNNIPLSLRSPDHLPPSVQRSILGQSLHYDETAHPAADPTPSPHIRSPTPSMSVEALKATSGEAVQHSFAQAAATTGSDENNRERPIVVEDKDFETSKASTSTKATSVESETVFRDDHEAAAITRGSAMDEEKEWEITNNVGLEQSNVDIRQPLSSRSLPANKKRGG
ncbi:MAG: hypothetical protein Q9217_006693 [Psora testacea]